ncbi:MAG TPA: hypothetical protein PKV72_06945, partial [Candidatus Peribacteria bacterium]|nr:hypothetical protein [Candidatus Peribacteria bacterium]
STWREPKVSAWKVPESRIRVRRLRPSTPMGRLRSRVTSAAQLRLSRWFFEARLPKWIDRRPLYLKVCRSPRPFSVSALSRPPSR